MNRLGVCTISLFVAAVFVSPLGTLARPQDDRQEHHQNRDDQRYYDNTHKDYHSWDGSEDTAWRQYQTDHHRDYRDFSSASKKQQADYWKWRHEHSDGDHH